MLYLKHSVLKEGNASRFQYYMTLRGSVGTSYDLRSWTPALAAGAPRAGPPWPYGINLQLALGSKIDCYSDVLARSRCVSRNMREIPSEMEFHGFLGSLENSDRNAHDRNAILCAKSDLFVASGIPHFSHRSA